MSSLRLKRRRDFLLGLVLSLFVFLSYVLLFGFFALVVKIASSVIELLNRGLGYG
jgi:hypothetical protein